MSSSSIVEVDESLYSRQLYVFGHEAQKKLASSSVLLMGMNGLGVETAKNIVLAGVKSVTIYDNTLTKFEDLSSQFYLNESDVGKPRSVSTVNRLAALNPYVDIILYDGEISTDVILKHSVVVMIDQPWEVQLHISEFCHLRNIAVLIGDVRGVFGTIFCDFGSEFIVHDNTGEQVDEFVIESITQDYPCTITIVEEKRHNLETGDIVTFSGLQGMSELNGHQVKVRVTGTHTLTVDIDTRIYSPYTSGGYVTPVKQPVTVHFRSLAETVYDPGMFQSDVMKMDSIPILHLAWRTLYKYRELNRDNFPEPGNLQHAQVFYDLALQLSGSSPGPGRYHVPSADMTSYETLLKRFAMCCRGVISPICALVGGILGQETIKACTGKFNPIQQWYYYNGYDVLPDTPLSMEEVQITHTRYDGNIIVLGRSIQQQLFDINTFLVGAGAIGCEMLKNWALMGISTGNGITHVTDMDHIERSNLSRQFLFTNNNIGSSKALTAVNVIKTLMNPQMNTKVYENKVGTETEDIFGDDFFDHLDIICAALDNIEARLYLDQRCLLYHKPMFESGTLGAKGHTQVVIPGLTENYGATRDPPEKSIPLCTLKSFPNRIEHTLQWAREYFEEIFKQIPENVNRYLENQQDFIHHLNSHQNTKLDTLQKIKDAFYYFPHTYDDCIKWARIQFEELFKNKIMQLLFTLPLDKMTDEGVPFWSGAKLPPTELSFDPSDPLHLEYIRALADMRAMVYSIPIPDSVSVTPSLINQIIAQVQLPVFRPHEGLKIATTEEEAKEESKNSSNSTSSSEYVDIDVTCNQILSVLPSFTSALDPTYRLQDYDFDKDIDSHMRVIYTVSNLRARNYRIMEADLHRSRGIAGKIIPAIATTTAMVTGMICLEMLKYIQKKPVEKYINSFNNLALPLFTSAEPDPPKTQTTLINGKEWKWTVWDRIEINNTFTMTLNDLIAYFDTTYNAELAMLSAGVSILYSSFSNPKKAAERKVMTLKNVYESVTKKTIPASQKYLIFEIILNDNDTGDELDVPYLRFQLRN